MKSYYATLVDMPAESLIIEITNWTREDFISWLCWNDPNGIYKDEQSLAELGNIMSRQEGMEIMLRQIMENR